MNWIVYTMNRKHFWKRHNSYISESGAYGAAITIASLDTGVRITRVERCGDRTKEVIVFEYVPMVNFKAVNLFNKKDLCEKAIRDRLKQKRIDEEKLAMAILTGPIELIPQGEKLEKKAVYATKIVVNKPATIVLWSDNTKTVVKCGPDDTFDPEKGVALCFMKKFLGNSGNYYNIFRGRTPKGEKIMIKGVEE